MEDSADNGLKLESHLNKCRCCFRPLEDQEFSLISEETEKKFFELTQIQVNILL